MNINFSEGAASLLRGYMPHEDFAVELVSAPEVLVSAGPVTPTVKDMTYAAVASTGTALKSDLLVITGPGGPAVTFESLTPAICTVDVTGKVGYVSDGTCSIKVSGRTGNRRSDQSVALSGAYTQYQAITGIAAGSLRAYLRDQQLAALAGVTPGTDAQRVHASIYNGGISGDGGDVNLNNFIRAQSQPGFDALPLDALDEILVGNAGSAKWRAWISPHHYLTWRGHGSSSVPGQSVSILGEVVVEYSATPWAGTLCKLLPTNWRDYLPDSKMSGITELALWTRHLNMYVANDQRWLLPAMRIAGVYGAEDPRRAYQRYTFDSGGNPLMSTGGDSGSPAFIGINGDLVPLGHTAYFGIVTSYWYGNLRAEIDNAMVSLNASGTYTAQTVDLSGFTQYP